MKVFKWLLILALANVLVDFAGRHLAAVTNSEFVRELITVIANLFFLVSVLIGFILVVFRKGAR